MENGFLRVPRNCFSSPAWKHTRVYSDFEAYHDLLQAAVWRNLQYFHKGRYFSLQPGDLITLSNRLGRRWGWSREQVREYLRRLAEGKVLTYQVEDGALKISLDAYCNARFTGLPEEFWSASKGESVPPSAGDSPLPAPVNAPAAADEAQKSGATPPQSKHELQDVTLRGGEVDGRELVHVNQPLVRELEMRNNRQSEEGERHEGCGQLAA